MSCDLVKYYLNNNKFPENYTKRIIVAVWPMSWATSLNEEAINRLAHFIHPSTVMPCFAKPKQTYDELNFLICSSAYCEYAKVLADTDAYQETKYIVIDGYSSVIDSISCSDTNFIIITPESYEKFKEYNGYYHELSMTEEEFIEYRKNLMGKTFHLITCDNLNKIFQDAHMLDAGINP